ncbi:MAG TPA: PEP-CTERM sorting domain-containing protein [Verrucomicrobiota bacterium]|nr:hypothetical protein [Verrucomicrobiales bacterium]HRI16627.1 PEP-CTERM sorting domain-containing protein [Verrucomicrobiota bacterium]
MKYHCWIRPLAFLGVAVLTLGQGQAQFARQVHDYQAGSGAANGYTNPAAALGEPSRITPGPFGGPVDPFNTAYLDSQLVSIGAGGSLTVKFATPLLNDPAHSYGLDFLIFGGAGFIITNAFDSEFNYIGTPATDGGMFGAQTGQTRVSVSADGTQFFTLNPALAPAVEALFPTDGQGNFSQPVNPALGTTAFAGLTLEGIRALYSASGGGAGFDLAWAEDAQGLPVELPAVNFVRIDVLSGKIEVDAFSQVSAVPEPAGWALLALGSVILAWRRNVIATNP